MKLTFQVDQKAALLRGINAPSSTVVLDVDPAQLTYAQRSVIAMVLHDGHDCTKQIVPGTGNGLYGAMRIELVEPTLDGLRQVLDHIIDRRAAVAKEAAERRDGEVRERDERVRAALAAYRAGEPRPTHRSYAFGPEVSIPTKIDNACTPALQAEVDAANVEIEAEQKRRGAEALRERDARREAERAREAVREAIFLALFTDEQRERHALGLLPRDEKRAAILASIPVIDDVVEVAKHVDTDRCMSDPVDDLTADEYANLKRLRLALTAAGVVHGADGYSIDEPELLTEYAKADDDDNEEDIDGDGDVKTGRQFVVLTVTRRLAGVSAAREYLLGVRLA